MTRILVVDDDSMMHKVIKFALCDHINSPYELDFAFSGDEARKKFHQHRADLVITDIVMPDMDGFELTIFLKTSDPAPYVIVMSGTNYANLHTAETLGPDFVLHKDDLIPKLANALSGFKASMAIN
ncbi:response regulator [Catenovulum sp. SM1970]|uniref:response regulator n=1 Tax=Marinifaba aquimaris TaxID=2741323 RepID=UPI001574573E|nr:response regulator [Marinifaba aquimaris]